MVVAMGDDGYATINIFPANSLIEPIKSVHLRVNHINIYIMKCALSIYIISCVILLLTGCGSNSNKNQENIPFNPHVEAFTNGEISRFSSVYLIFNSDIPVDKITTDQVDKHITIKPKVEGKWSFENNNTLVFKPKSSFERNTSYRVKADISSWFDTDERDGEFSFGFSTYPMAIWGELASLDVNDNSDNSYDITVLFYTKDMESADNVASILSFSEKVESSWHHDLSGKRHELILKNVQAGKDGGRNLKVSVSENKFGLRKGELLSVVVPGQNDFLPYDIKYVSGSRRYVEVTFTKRLDPNQYMKGLAFIADNKQENVTVEGNKLRLYPDAGSSKGDVLNVHINQGIKAADGNQLKESSVRQIDMGDNKPNCMFVGEGVILPSTSDLSVPFRSVNLRGVTVSVIKILEQNIGQFLQTNQLDDSGELMRVGRLVARKTIFMDDKGVNLSRWNTFAIDMKDIVEPEPGAIYRLELSFDRRLSTYPCGADSVNISKEQILAEDKVRLKEEQERFDEGGYYYFHQYDWSTYDWNRRDDPCSDSYYFNRSEGKNILATDIGLVAKMGQDNKMIVMAFNLTDTEPLSDVQVVIHNYQHQVVAKGVTDKSGMIELETHGAPFYLIAQKERQRSYLRVDNGSSLSFSSFDVAGEVVQRGIKGFIYGERGVWRPGDTIRVGFMLNDKAKALPESHPVIMELYNPLGQLYAKQSKRQSAMGLYMFDFPTLGDATTGAWSIKVQVGGVIFTKRLRVESIKPNRLKIEMSTPGEMIASGKSVDAKLHAEWLQGAPAKNLKYDVIGTFISTPTSFRGYNGFKFDDPSRIFNTEESKLITGELDDRGNATINSRLELGSTAPGMLMANIVTKVYEESGDFSIDAIRKIYSPFQRYVGIKSPQIGKERLATGVEHNFEVATVDSRGVANSNVDLEVSIYKVNWYWWWSADGGELANYVSSSYNKPIKRMTIKSGQNGRASFKLSFSDDEWGTYFISVKDRKGKHSTGVMSYFDSLSSDGRRDANGGESATMLNFRTDKDSYMPGEKMAITFPSSEDSRAIVSIENGVRVISVNEYGCKDDYTTVNIDVTEEMRPNAYVNIMLIQPHGQKSNDMPIRLYGAVPVTVTSRESRLEPLISAPAEIKPEEKYSFTISEKRGKQMAYTLAVVDEGLLDLTRFATPDPWRAFNAREALGVNTWDLYNHVVGAYGGRIEQLFSIGGDDALNRCPKAIVNRFKPVALMDGPFVLKPGESRRHTYDMPNYNGRVRIMVVAGDGEAYGSAEKSVMVRKPLMLLGTLPRTIGIGEEMVVPVTVFATEDGIGDVNVSISCSSNMEIIGGGSQLLSFGSKGDKQARFRIRVKNNPGVGKIKIIADGRGDRSTYEAELEIRSVSRRVTRSISATVEPGESWSDNLKMPGMSGTNSLKLEISSITPLNIASRIRSLIDYPHGCLEQITSRAFPLLFTDLIMDQSIEERDRSEAIIKDVIGRLRSYQTVEGSFSYWPGGSSSNGWGTVYATHLLVEASRRGYMIPEALSAESISYLQRSARGWRSAVSPNAFSEDAIQAYRLYVLALAGSPEIGAMNRLKELSAALSANGRWLLAATYSLIGRGDVARDIISRTSEIKVANQIYDETFGSEIRDRSIQLLTLLQLNEMEESTALAREISSTLSSDEWLSTQSISFALLAMSNYLSRYKSGNTMSFEYDCAGKSGKMDSDKGIWYADIFNNGGSEACMKISNMGKSTLFIKAVMDGIPERGEEGAYSKGISMAVSYVDMKGREINVDRLEQGTNFSAIVTVKNPSAHEYSNLVLTEIFPSGWEILNSRFLNAAADTLMAGVNYQDIKDDRVYSYIDRLPAGKQVTVKINLCAVYPGRFYMPPIYCEAMYNNTVLANSVGREVTVR